MTCNSGSLENIVPPQTPDPCGCECSTSDLTYTGAPFECAGVLPNEKLDSLLTKILTKLCNMSSDIDVSTITWDCVSNPPEDTDVVSILQFIADNGVFKSGNDCDCPITGDLTFSVGHGLKDCSTGQQSVLFLSNGIVETTANKQNRVASDLRVDAGFGAGIDSVVVANLDLSVTAPNALKLSYVIQAGESDITITLPNLKDTLGYNANRMIAFKREDCNTATTVSLVGFDTDTVDGAASFDIPAGHSVILHGDAVPNTGAWHIMADYGSYCADYDGWRNLVLAGDPAPIFTPNSDIIDIESPAFAIKTQATNDGKISRVQFAGYLVSAGTFATPGVLTNCGNFGLDSWMPDDTFGTFGAFCAFYDPGDFSVKKGICWVELNPPGLVITVLTGYTIGQGDYINISPITYLTRF